MKLKKIMAGLGIGCFSVLALVGLGGCGDVSLSTITQNFAELETVFQDNSSVFSRGIIDGMESNYVISYGTKIDNFVDADVEGFGELEEIYNATLVIASDYVDSNKHYVTNLHENDLSSSTRRQLNILNSSITTYRDSIEDFLVERTNFITYFDNFETPILPGESKPSIVRDAYLRRFKRSYGAMVANSVQLCSDMAEVIESTEILTLLETTSPTTEADTEVVKEYIRAKMLPLFSEFQITEIENKMNWAGQTQTATKTRIDTLLQNLQTAFESYKKDFVTSTASLQVLTNQQITEVFNMTSKFILDTEDYMDALIGLNIERLAVSFDCDMERYLNSNNMAEIYLEKLEQFVTKILPNFENQVVEMIY